MVEKEKNRKRSYNLTKTMHGKMFTNTFVTRPTMSLKSFTMYGYNIAWNITVKFTAFCSMTQSIEST